MYLSRFFLLVLQVLLLWESALAQTNLPGIATGCQFTPGPVDDWDWTVDDPTLPDEIPTTQTRRPR
jgi:hypothetical protein